MEIEIRCSAPKDRSVHLVIEPWADEFEIEAGAFVRLIARDVLPDGLEFVWNERGPMVWFPTGSTFALLSSDGTPLMGSDLKVPRYPFSPRLDGEQLA